MCPTSRSRSRPACSQALGPAHTQFHIFATQAYTLDLLRAHWPSNPIHFVRYGAYSSLPASRLRQPALRTSGPIHACFTSLGQASDKGADDYLRIVDAYKSAYPTDEVVFHGVGNVPSHRGIVSHDAMPQVRLDEVSACGFQPAGCLVPCIFYQR